MTNIFISRKILKPVGSSLTTLKTIKTENERDKGYKKISELLGLRGCIKAKDLIKNFVKKEKTSHF